MCAPFFVAVITALIFTGAALADIDLKIIAKNRQKNKPESGVLIKVVNEVTSQPATNSAKRRFVAPSPEKSGSIVLGNTRGGTADRFPRHTQ